MGRSTVQVRVLGHLDVRSDGALVGPPMGAVKPRMLLGALAANANHVLSKNALVERLWENPPPTARNLIEKYVSAWRKVFDDETLRTVGAGYRLELSADCCDLLAAERFLAQAREHHVHGDDASAAVALDAAVALWDDEPEEQLISELPSIDGSRLVELYLNTVEEWASASLAAGTADSRLLSRLTAALQRHPLRERLAELTMWSLARQGRQQEALECYQAVRHALAEDLGQDPGAALNEMYLRILRQDPVLRSDTSPAARIDNLPPRNRRFVGRVAELARLDAALHAPTAGGAATSAVATWGLVGTGKSALALEWAHRSRDRYECVWWVDAGSSTSTAAGLEALANELGCQLDVERQPSLYRVWDELRRRGPALVIFDDASSASALAAYLPPADTAHVLITSLNPEWHSLADPLHIDVLSHGDAVTYMRHRIGTAAAAIESALLDELGQLPLAMSQAAAYIEQTGMSPGQYLPLFRRRRAQLLQRGVPDDHQGTIETTWRLAEAELRVTHPSAVELLQLCSLLGHDNISIELLRANPGGLSAELRDAVFDELRLEDAIREARRYSLMSRDGERLRMHFLVQSVIASSLPAEERQVWRTRAANALLALAPDGCDSPDTWSLWESLVPHVRALAEAWRPATPPPSGFEALSEHAAQYLLRRGEFEEAVDLMRHTQALIEACAPTPDDVSVGRSLTRLGLMLEEAGHLKEALIAQQRALEILERTTDADDPSMACAVGGLASVLICHSGVSFWKATELDEAERRFVSALAILEHAFGEHHPVVPRLIAGLGQVRQDRGDLVGGTLCFERALRITESLFEAGHPDIGHCLDRLAYALGLCGETERARECYERATTILTDAYGAAHIYVGWSLSNLAVLLTTVGELDAARAHQLRAHDIFTANADEIAVLISSWRLARIELAAGRCSAAKDLLEPAVRTSTELLGEDHHDVVGMRADLLTAQQGSTVGTGIQRLRIPAPTTELRAAPLASSFRAPGSRECTDR
jgi:DNA-binding SARP family transcriptional activator/tetratricopeptide (TPR) repeat protein